MDRLEVLEAEISEIKKRLKVKVKNGREKEVWLNEVVQDIYTDIEILRDFNKVHLAFKKYKVYWLILIVVFLYMGLDIKSALLKMLAG